MIIYDHPQGSAEWLASRAGVITASKFVEARKRLKVGPKKGGFTEAAEDYAFRVAVERISGAPLDEGFSTWAMKPTMLWPGGGRRVTMVGFSALAVPG